MAGHVVIAGMTESGKTYLAVSLATGYQKKGIPVLVLTPRPREGWPTKHVYTDPEYFLELVKGNTRCAVFVDECGTMIGRCNAAMEWLATESRHNGHRVHFLMQGGTQVSPIIRDNCGQLFLFRVSRKAGLFWQEEFADDALAEAQTLPKYVFFDCQRFRAAVRKTLKS